MDEQRDKCLCEWRVCRFSFRHLCCKLRTKIEDWITDNKLSEKNIIADNNISEEKE